MQQMCRYVITGLFLSICSFQDMRMKRLSVRLLLCFGVIGLIVDICFQTAPLLCIIGILPGISLVLLGRVSRQQIGYGDGFAVMVIGLLLPGKETIAILLMGLFLCACSSVVILCMGKGGKKTVFPFIPFLEAGFFLCLFTRG